MKQVFITSDKEQFDTAAEARAHENGFKIRNALDFLIREAESDGKIKATKESVIEFTNFLIEKRHEISKALVADKTRRPRRTKAEKEADEEAAAAKKKR